MTSQATHTDGKQGGDRHILRVSDFVQGYLREHGEGTIKEMRGEYAKAINELPIHPRRHGAKYRVASYASFVRKVFELKKEGLVEKTGREVPSDDEPELLTWQDNPSRSVWRLSKQ